MTVAPDMAVGIRAAAWLVGALVAAMLMNDSWAGRGGGHGGYHGHHHHGHAHFGTSFFIGGTYWPYFPPPYYSYYAVPYEDPGTVYVERFDGTPTPDTPGEIFCPNADAYYPDVSECPGGWQRVIRPAS